MKSLARCLLVDLKRSIVSTRFLVSVAGFSILLCLNLPIDAWPEEAPYLFSLSYKYGFYIFFFLAAAIPYAQSYLADIDGGYIKSVVQRVPLTAYSFSRCIAVMLSGGFAIVLSTLVFLLFLYLQYPASSDVAISYSGWDALISQGRTAGYYMLKTFFTAMLGGNFALFALNLSTVIKNSFVVLASPVLLYYCANELATLLKIPAWCNILGLLYYPPFPEHLLDSVLYYTAMLCILFVISSWVFYLQMRRLHQHGYCP